MTIDDLKEWMDERFITVNNRFDSTDRQLTDMNKKITSHDRWLWLIRGIGIAGLSVLGFLGFKVGS